MNVEIIGFPFGGSGAWADARIAPLIQAIWDTLGRSSTHEIGDDGMVTIAFGTISRAQRFIEIAHPDGYSSFSDAVAFPLTSAASATKRLLAYDGEEAARSALTLALREKDVALKHLRLVSFVETFDRATKLARIADGLYKGVVRTSVMWKRYAGMEDAPTACFDFGPETPESAALRDAFLRRVSQLSGAIKGPGRRYAFAHPHGEGGITCAGDYIQFPEGLISAYTATPKPG